MPCDKVETAKAWRDANVQPRINATEAATIDALTVSDDGASGPAPRYRSGEGSDRLYWLSRVRREQAEAAIAELREAELRGTLINKAGAERAISTGFRLMRDSVLAVPDRLRSRALAIRPIFGASPSNAISTQRRHYFHCVS